MKGLARERAAGQARQAPQTRIEKLTQLPLGSGRTGALDRDSHRQLAHRQAILGANSTAGPIDLPDQVSCSANQINAPTSPGPTVWVALRSATRGGSAGPSTILACDGAAAPGIPHGLHRDAMAMTADFSFEYMHVLSCGIAESKNQAEFNIYAIFCRGVITERCRVCESRARGRSVLSQGAGHHGPGFSTLARRMTKELDHQTQDQEKGGRRP